MTQRPSKPIDHGDRAALLKIKVGDSVWVGESQRPCAHGIKAVTRLTNTLIIVGGGKSRWERFRRDSGWQVGKAMFMDYISGIATPAEIQAFEAKQAREAQEAEEKRQADARREAKQQELIKLFSGKAYAHQGSGSDQENGLWSLSVSGLSEEQVRAIACFPRHVAGLLNWLGSNQGDGMNRVQVEDHAAIVRAELKKITAAYGR